MYRAFELKVGEDILKNHRYKNYVACGRNMINTDRPKIKELLRDVFYNGTIDGTSLTETYFPVLRRDVFLSYSHNDQDLAYMVAGLLNSCFKLTVFIDSMFWGSADDLLQVIDDEYCLQKSSKTTYDYHKRNFSTSHVHAMLTAAIMKAMDQAEIIIFLNTPKSVPILSETMKKGNYDEYTLSPWIYEEILLTTMLKETSWEFYRQSWRMDGRILKHYEKALNIRYKMPKEKLVSLTIDDIGRWYQLYEERKKSSKGCDGGIFLQSWDPETHPLNVLYEFKCGVEN